MSGTETLVEIVLNLPAPQRTEWRAMAEAQKLQQLSEVPRAEGRLELVESEGTITALAFFSEEAEARAEILIDAFRAAAPLGATGSGTYLLLVDYQRDEGHSLTIAEGSSTLAKLPKRRARAKHAVLDAFLERCVTPPTPPAPAIESEGPLGEASREALATLRLLPAGAVDAAWARVKQTTMTSAAIGVTRKQEKQLLKQLEKPPPHWEWARALPLRLMFTREPQTMEPIVLQLLALDTLKQQERWMLLESMCDSTTDLGLDTLVASLGAERFLASAARLALGHSVHPRATDAIVSWARDWLERTTTHPEQLSPMGNPFSAGTVPSEGIGVLGLLELRAAPACDALLREVWERLYAVRARIPHGAEGIAVQAAITYVTRASRDLAPEVVTSLRRRLPHPGVPLDDVQRTIDELHRNLLRG